MDGSSINSLRLEQRLGLFLPVVVKPVLDSFESSKQVPQLDLNVVNRTAKLKQSKLDVRREQWLSQVKNKGCKEEINSGSHVKMHVPEVHARNDDLPVMKLDINPVGEENEGLINHYSDSESPSNIPMSSVFGSNISPSHFTSNSSSSSMTDEDDGDNECLDDWEAIADALAADDTKNNNVNPDNETPAPRLPEPDSVAATMASQDDCFCQAWRADDAFRPQSLPNFLKQNSFRCFKNVCSPSTCPRCCEDLDLTDTSFLPCPCGCRLCLFCHKRILEDDGRCPGCRKQYDHHGPGNVSLKMGRSYSTMHWKSIQCLQGVFSANERVLWPNKRPQKHGLIWSTWFIIYMIGYTFNSRDRRCSWP